MRRFPALTFITLLFALLATIPVRAQDAATLDWLDIKLWPEFDDPRLLVIIDGQPSNPGQTILVPVPAQAVINAVASADETGRFIDNEWTAETSADDGQVVSLTPEGVFFRVEYYIPMEISGDVRLIDLAIPAGHFNADQASIEILLPPDSTGIETNPLAEMRDETSTGAALLVRDISAVSAEEPIAQNISYSNPTGTLTMPGNESPAVPSQEVQAQEAASSSQNSTSSVTGNPLLIGLAIAAVALIAGGIYGLWRTRSPNNASPPAKESISTRSSAKKATQSRIATGQDRFCRQCGTDFGEGDRFCRKCGAKRL